MGSKSFIEIVRERVTHDRIYYFPNWAEKIIEENNIKYEVKANLIPNALKIMYTGNLGKSQDFGTLSKAIIKNQKKKISNGYL